MNESNLFIFIYIITIIFGVVFTTLIFVVAGGDKSPTLKAVRNLSFAILSYAIFDFLLYYFSSVGASETIKLILLVFSDLSFFSLILCWIFVLSSSFHGYEVIKKNKFLKFTGIYVLLAEFLSIMNIVQEPESNLSLSGANPATYILLISNIIFDTIFFYIGIRYFIYGIKIVTGKSEAKDLNTNVNKSSPKKQFILPSIFAAILSIYAVWVIWWDYSFITDLLFRADNIGEADPIILIYILFCLNAISFIYKKRLSKKGYLDEKALLKDYNKDEIAKKYGLTKRESEVLEKILLGHSNIKIAEELYVSEHTVKRHINTIFKKTGVKGRYELMTLKG